MKWIRALLPALIALGLIVVLNKNFGMVPPFGKFLSPFEGFWQNSEKLPEAGQQLTFSIKGLRDEVQVYIDERLVPHVFAKNNEDLYFMQGYLTARDRLWEMDFISYVAAGRISELVGERALEADRAQRRIGLSYGAEQAIKQLDNDPLAKLAITNYSNGVNAYINSLAQKQLPLEYKLLNYQPEQWTPLKTALLLKFMAKMLAAGESDFEFNNALNLFGRETFDRLYPDWAGTQPIIPEGTSYASSTVKVDTPALFTIKEMLMESAFEAPRDKNIGSNNWAVSGRKTSTGKPILCGDPHLGLYLPSIWYEMQLVSPDVNAYGVTLPGAPCIIIGFNQYIAWSETNAGRDVKDWYKIQFLDAERNYYAYNGQKRPTTKRIEQIKVRDGVTFNDTVIYTHYGPVSYDRNFKRYGKDISLAMRWTALDASNEMRTFYLMNRAKNHADYLNALSTYECPAQNFVFACVDGDIAIKQQGKFVAKWKEQGKFVMDGTSSQHEWQGYIPYEQNPQILNPARGFVSSANQHPTDSTYPYYYNGGFEYDRNRRINEVLEADSIISPEDLMKLQLDNFNYTAAEALPLILQYADSNKYKAYVSELKTWNYHNDPELKAPAIFQSVWEQLYPLLWDEFLPDDSTGLDLPNTHTTVAFLRNYPNDPLMDNKSTGEKETASVLIAQAFQRGIDSLEKWKAGKDDFNWTNYKATKVQHWIRQDPLSRNNVYGGGWKHIVNATDKASGPSWRMIVALGETPQAWVVYPGGQSGNPGNPNYDTFIDKWSKGDYYQVNFMTSAPKGGKEIVHIFKPTK